MPFNPNQARGADGKWIKTGGALGAALVAGVLAAAGGGDVVTSVGAGLDAAAGRSTGSTNRATSRQAAKTGDEAKAWERLALKELKKDVRHRLRCAVQSRGQVRQFFVKHPCDKLDQFLFAVSDAKGDVVVGSVMWVKMPSSAAATQLKQLEDTPGTGDVTPFGTEVLQLGGFQFTGEHYRSRLDGSLVVIAETEPVRGHPSDSLLNDVATVAVVLPPK
ncbi:hypothetical protein [Actinocrispum wychmicini]|uniref:Uncharacterized protein n=1 Tax=Actinocrispum wychmicini TaxID=1213861 RepID=A0A4V2S549_9PSEU|nr:hypothetical protein [Actinocrispum wychmicini]TCO50740.1 hypothetical protein EV192_113118 [Actinocrispum wychmicini]